MNIFRQWSLLLIIIILCGTAIALIHHGAFMTHQDNLLTYTNQQFGFSFEYPAQWGKASVETVSVSTLQSSYQATEGNFWFPSGVAFNFSVAPLRNDISGAYMTPQQFVDGLIAQDPSDVLTQESISVDGRPALEATAINGISHDETVYIQLNASDDVLILETDLTRLSSSTFNTILQSVRFTK